MIPAGALSTNTEIKVEQSSAGAPTLPAGFIASGPMFAFTPHGTAFALPVTITLPFDPSLVPAGNAPVLYKTNAQNQWEQIANATFGADSVSAQVTGFSHATIVVPPLTRDDPERIWEFNVFPSDGSAEVTLPCRPASCTQIGGLVDDFIDLGAAHFSPGILRPAESIPINDGFANGYVLSAANGVTYAVVAEAPVARPGTSDPNGSVTRLTQRQSFIKRAADAALTFTVTAVVVEAGDWTPHDARTQRPIPLMSEVMLDVAAYKTPNAYFFHGAGYAVILGDNGEWQPVISGVGDAQTQLWELDDFDVKTGETVSYTVGSSPVTGTCVGTRGYLELKQPLTYTVDLSSIEVNEEFSLRVITHAQAWNRKGGVKEDCQANYAYAALRDPQEIGGTTLTIKGLEPSNRPLPGPSEQQLVAPAACVPGSNAAAGVLQFDAASFMVEEHSSAVPTVTVSRSGGSSGAVTATFTTSDGTAVAGNHYTAVNATVFFGDGETAARRVSVPIISNQIDEADRTVNLTLSQPGGCATLGTQSAAILTILDDELPPPTGTPAALDTSFGIEGKASLAAFGGDRSAMTLQPDGKIVMVGGRFTDFVLARFNADGTLDSSFDADGKVTTDMVAGEQEEALGVAIQADGKIVVVGYTGTPGSGGPANFAIARYNADGSLDSTFGAGGKVVSGVPGIAHAVAIQPNGRIVVAGDVPRTTGNDFSDFALARYNTNGTLDADFGPGGQFTTDIGAGTNTARNILLQANGAIVVSGEPIGTFTGSDHTDVTRYDADGNPDPGFGSGGKVALSGARVGEGLALQSDGKLVLAGTIDASVPPAAAGSVTEFALMRLNANGSPDAAFGTVHTAISGERDAARAVALQGDGKIVVAGQSSNINVDFGVARFNSDGTLDTSFGNEGKLEIDFFGFTDVANSVAIQPDGRIVLGGAVRDDVDGYGVARVLP